MHLRFILNGRVFLPPRIIKKLIRKIYVKFILLGATLVILFKSDGLRSVGAHLFELGSYAILVLIRDFVDVNNFLFLHRSYATKLFAQPSLVVINEYSLQLFLLHRLRQSLTDILVFACSIFNLLFFQIRQICQVFIAHIVQIVDHHDGEK